MLYQCCIHQYCYQPIKMCILRQVTSCDRRWLFFSLPYDLFVLVLQPMHFLILFSHIAVISINCEANFRRTFEISLKSKRKMQIRSTSISWFVAIKPGFRAQFDQKVAVQATLHMTAINREEEVEAENWKQNKSPQPSKRQKWRGVFRVWFQFGELLIFFHISHYWPRLYIYIYIYIYNIYIYIYIGETKHLLLLLCCGSRKS